MKKTFVLNDVVVLHQVKNGQQSKASNSIAITLKLFDRRTLVSLTCYNSDCNVGLPQLLSTNDN